MAKYADQRLEEAVFGGKADFLPSTRKRAISDTVSESEQPAWLDEDEGQISKFENISKPTWVKAKKIDDNEKIRSPSNEDELLATDTPDFITDGVLQTGKLPKSTLIVKACRDLNYQRRNELQVTALKFHPEKHLALVGGHDRRLNLFNVDGQTNSEAASVYFEDFPIEYAEFIRSRNLVMLTSFTKEFFMYNMETCQVIPFSELPGTNCREVRYFTVSTCGVYVAIQGASGVAYVMLSRNMQLISKLQLNDIVVAMHFSADSQFLNCIDVQGFVYVYEVRSMPRCLRRFRDVGSIHGSCISLSPDQSILAAASYNGILNFYDFQSIRNETCKEYKPIKVFKNLFTNINCVKFNHTNELCAYSSHSDQTSYKMIHLGTLSVFSNMPERNKDLGYVTKLDISPNSKYFAASTKAGRVYLYSLSHFSSY